MIQTFLLRAQGWALTALAVLLVLVGAYSLGGIRAKRAAEKRNEADGLRRDLATERGNSAAKDAAIDAARVRRETEDAAAAKPPGKAQDELQRDWRRD